MAMDVCGVCGNQCQGNNFGLWQANGSEVGERLCCPTCHSIIVSDQPGEIVAPDQQEANELLDLFGFTRDKASDILQENRQ